MEVYVGTSWSSGHQEDGGLVKGRLVKLVSRLARITWIEGAA